MTLIRRTLWYAGITCSLVACSDPSSPGSNLAASLDATERQVASSSNDFSFALFQQLATSEAGKNVVISPLSASMSLGMTMNGAAGTTLEAMRTALHLGTNDMASLDAAYRGLIDALRQADATTTFTLANSIWYRSGFPFRQSFLDTTKKYFDATVQGLDFTNEPASLATING